MAQLEIPTLVTSMGPRAWAEINPSDMLRISLRISSEEETLLPDSLTMKMMDFQEALEVLETSEEQMEEEEVLIIKPDVKMILSEEDLAAASAEALEEASAEVLEALVASVDSVDSTMMT